MPQYTPNLNLYKWDKTDSKVDTITEMASNAHKIDTKLKNVDDSIAQINNDLLTTTETANNAVQQIEQVQTESSQAVTTSNEAKTIAETANTKADVNTTTVNEAKTIASEAKTTAETVKNQFDEVTKASSIDPQVSQALIGADGKTYANIGNRFDTVDAHLAHKATKDELNALGQLKLDGTYDTLTALQTAKPTGATGLYLVIADGFTYRWSGSAWTKAVQFQSTGIGDKTITIEKISDDAKEATWNKARAKSNSGVKRIYVEKIYDIESYRASLAVGNSYNARFSYYATGTAINNIRTTLFINDINTLGQLGNAKRIDSPYVVPQANTILNYSQPTGVYATSDLRYVHVLLSLDGDTDLGFIDFFFKNCKLFIGNTEIVAQDTFGFYLCDSASTITPNSFLGTELATIKTLEQKISQIDVISPDSQWKGKTWYTFGHSIVWQDGQPYGDGQQVGQIARGYQTVVKEKLGIGSVVNKGVNGNICQWMINDFKNSDKNFDAASFDIGTNDFMKHVPLGVLGDTTNTTFYGCLDVLCKEIANTTPSKTVFFMTPLKRWGYVYEGKSTTMTNDEGVHLSAFVQAMKEVCGGVYGYPVIDLYSMSQINQYNINTYTRDGLHPIDIGYKNIGQLVAHFMGGLTA